MIYSPYQKGPLTIIGDYDPDSDHYFGFKFRPDVWQQNKVYEIRDKDFPDLVIPTVYSGFYAECTNPGTSGGTEPNWNKTSGGLTIEANGVTWKMQPYNFMPIGVSIAASTWEPQGATITNESFTPNGTQCLIVDVTATDYFYLINHVTYSNGGKDDFTAKFKVRER